MSIAVVGSTGLIGGTICAQTEVQATYNSTNIASIRGRSFDTVFCAGARAVKWKANQQPEVDITEIQSLIQNLKTIETGMFVLISTVDVYQNPVGVDEFTPVNTHGLEPYGLHRYILEQFVRQRFPAVRIVRLPGVFGKGLKKNLIYDLMNGNALHLIHSESRFQFYNLENLFKDLQIVLENSAPLVNMAVEPVRAADLAERAFGVPFHNDNGRPPVAYDMRSRFANLCGKPDPYMYTADDTYEGVARLVRSIAVGA
jgi:nucleoside-diphosphate-sugar epimerase